MPSAAIIAVFGVLLAVAAWAAYTAGARVGRAAEQRRLEAARSGAEQTARRGVQKAKDAGVRAQGVLERGDVAGILVNESRDSSLVVLGKRGLHGLRGRLGSVSAATAAHAECPVIVLPETIEPTLGDFTGRVVVALIAG